MKTEKFFLLLLKKLKILIFSIICFFVFSSCSDLVSGYVYEKAETMSGARYVYISVESEENGSPLSVARTITAPGIDFSKNTENYYFYVWGKSSTGSVSPRKVDFSSSSATTGTIELDFPVTTYTFILAATTSKQETLTADSILQNAISVGFTNADLSNSTSIKFTLSPKGLSAYGAVYLNFYLDDTWTDNEVTSLLTNYNVKVGIYDNNGALWDGYNEISLYPLSKTEAIQSGSWWTNVPSGEFDLIIKMTQRYGNYSTFTYSDKIIIEPNRTINSDFFIPNILDNTPEAPSDFKAAWCMDYRIYSIYDSESETSLSLDENSNLDEYNFDGYGLILNWKDNSNNETGFKITLVDVSKIATDTISSETFVSNVPSTITDSYWSTLVTPYYYNKNIVKTYTSDSYYTAKEYIAGSVGRNENTLILYAPFGSCYIAKIEAVNAAGLSGACYATLTDAVDARIYDENYGDNTIIYRGNAFNSTVINVYKIVYYFSGGILSYTENNTIKTNTSDYMIKYHTYGNGSIICPIAPNAASGTPSTPALLDTGTPWRRWVYGAYNGTNLINILGGTTITVDENYSYQKPADYTGYTSLYLFARYD